jgi:hypothetical protein
VDTHGRQRSSSPTRFCGCDSSHPCPFPVRPLPVPCGARVRGTSSRPGQGSAPCGQKVGKGVRTWATDRPELNLWPDAAAVVAGAGSGTSLLDREVTADLECQKRHGRRFARVRRSAVHNCLEEVTRQVTYGDAVLVVVFVEGDDRGEEATGR